MGRLGGVNRDEGERVGAGARTNASDGEVGYGRRDSSSWETLSCSESCDIHATAVFGEPGWCPTDQPPTGAAGCRMRQHFLLFVFKYRGPLAWTSISILCSSSSFCVPQVLRITTIVTTDVALAKDEPLGVAICTIPFVRA